MFANEESQHFDFFPVRIFVDLWKKEKFFKKYFKLADKLPIKRDQKQNETNKFMFFCFFPVSYGQDKFFLKLKIKKKYRM